MYAMEDLDFKYQIIIFFVNICLGKLSVYSTGLPQGGIIMSPTISRTHFLQYFFYVVYSYDALIIGLLIAGKIKMYAYVITAFSLSGICVLYWQ